MRRRTRRAALGSVLIVSGLFLSRLDAKASEGTTAGATARLLGPFAGLASDATWFAAQRAIQVGESARAVVLAERAVSLAPREAFGWERYAALVGTLLASPESEPDPSLRLAWVRAALTIYARGEAVCDEPGALALARAVLLVSRTESDPDLPWPGGPAEPWELAAEAFDAATEAHPLAWEFAEQARNAARELR